MSELYRRDGRVHKEMACQSIAVALQTASVHSVLTHLISASTGSVQSSLSHSTQLTVYMRSPVSAQ
jgi:hypothetical protein